jgi:hypothetical protein
MIPSGNKILTTDLNVVTLPSRQHRMDFDRNRILGTCDGQESVKQSIFKILNTERYSCLIYSWNYGIELKDLYGEPPAFVCPELARRITEALLQDDRITGVDGFEFDNTKKGVVSVSFTVHTFFGDLDEEMAVNI